MSQGTITPAEQQFIDDGFAYWHEELGRIIPIIRGGEPTEEELAAEREAEAAAAEAAKTEKKFTQADVDRMITDRLARDRRDRPSDEEIAELRTSKTKLEEIEAANQSELEKTQARAEAAEKARDAALETAKETTLKAAILAEASKADRKVVDPQAVLSLIDRSALTLDDAGNPTNIAETMDALLTDKAYLVGTGGTTRTTGAADQGARGTTANQLENTDGMTEDEIATAVVEGRLDNYLASTK